MNQTLEQLYQGWKRPTSSYSEAASTDYAYGEDSYTFKEYALFHEFTESEIDDFLNALADDDEEIQP